MLPQDPSWRRRVFALMDRRIGIFIRQGGGGLANASMWQKKSWGQPKFIRLEAPSDELVKRCQQESYYCETDRLKGKKPIRPTSFSGREGRACTSMNGWAGPNCPMTLPWLKMISLAVSQSTTRRFQEDMPKGHYGYVQRITGLGTAWVVLAVDRNKWRSRAQNHVVGDFLLNDWKNASRGHWWTGRIVRSPCHTRPVSDQNILTREESADPAGAVTRLSQMYWLEWVFIFSEICNLKLHGLSLPTAWPKDMRDKGEYSKTKDFFSFLHPLFPRPCRR